MNEATPVAKSAWEPYSSGVLVVRARGEVWEFDADTHTYEVWVNDETRDRLVEIRRHDEQGVTIVKSIRYPDSIERDFTRWFPKDAPRR